MKRSVLATIFLYGATVLSTAGPAVVLAQQGTEDEMPTYDLSLEKCLRTALANNLDLVSARKDPAISAERVNEQDAAFDGAVSISTDYRKQETEPVNAFTGASNFESLSLISTWSQSFLFGGNYSASLGAFKTLDSRSVDDPFYDASLTLAVDIPLLRGLGREPTTERLELSRRNLEISRDELRRRAEQTMETVESAYWDLAAARRAREVAYQSLQRAEELLALNRKKVEVGTLAPIEITQAEAGVASERENVIVAENDLDNAEDELRRLLAVPENDPLWGMRVLPTSRPVLDPRKVDVDAAIEQALASRPEVHSARKTLLNSELSERTARNGTLHDLAFNTSYSLQGNNRNLSPFLGVAIPDGKIDEAFSELTENDFFDWRIGLTYTIPVGNKAAKASYRIATIGREKSEVDLDNQEQTVRVEVRRAARNVLSGAERVAAAQVNVELQREKLDAEQKKFENGMSTSFEVLTFQEDLANAELRLIRAALDYNKSLAALERSKGVLLEARGLSLAE